MTTRVGELSVTPLSDGELWTAPDGLLNKAAEAWPPGYLNGDGLMGVNFGGFLVRTRARPSLSTPASAAARSLNCRSARFRSGWPTPASLQRTSTS